MFKGKKKGFTLMEMMIVITILIILIALLVPKFLGYSDKAKDAVAETNAKAVVTAIGLYQAEEGTEKKSFLLNIIFLSMIRGLSVAPSPQIKK